MPQERKSKRSAKKVDYSKVDAINGLSDDDEDIFAYAPKTSSDSSSSNRTKEKKALKKETKTVLKAKKTDSKHKLTKPEARNSSNVIIDLDDDDDLQIVSSSNSGSQSSCSAGVVPDSIKNSSQSDVIKSSPDDNCSKSSAPNTQENATPVKPSQTSEDSSIYSPRPLNSQEKERLLKQLQEDKKMSISPLIRPSIEIKEETTRSGPDLATTATEDYSPVATKRCVKKRIVSDSESDGESSPAPRNSKIDTSVGKQTKVSVEKVTALNNVTALKTKLVMPKWKPPGPLGSDRAESSNARPMGLRIGLSRRHVVQPLHPSAKLSN